MSNREEKVLDILNSALEEGRNILTEYESKQILSLWDVSVAETKLATTELEAVDAAREIKYPIVMKVASPDITDKSEVDGIRIGISSEIEVRQAFEDLKINAKSQQKDADIHGVVIQKYVPDATEVVIGVIQDPSFGPTVTFGLGGVWIEVLEDMSYRLSPVSAEDAEEMIKEINGYQILAGVRDRQPVDIEGIVDVIKKTSELPVEFREIFEIDLNPVFAFNRGDGATVVDAKITLRGS